MPKQRSAIARGLHAAAVGASESIGLTVQRMLAEAEQRRREEAIFDRQRQLAEIQHKFQLEEQRRQQEAIASREAATRTQQGYGKLMEEASAGATPMPALLARAKSLGFSDPAYAGVGPEVNIPGQGPTYIPGHPVRAAGEAPSEIELLIRAAEAGQTGKRRADMQSALAKPHIGPEGVTGFQDPTGAFRPTELTGSQAAERKLASEFDPRLVSAGARRAAAEAGAETSARIGAEYSNIDKIRALAEARREDKSPAGATGPLAGLATQVNELKKIEPMIQAGEGPMGLAKGVIQNIRGIARMDNDATMYRGIGDSMLSLMARGIGKEVGNLNEFEQRRFARLVPRVYDPASLRARKYEYLQRIIAAGMTGGPAAFEQASIEAEAAIAREEGGTQPPAGLSSQDIINRYKRGGR